MQQLAARFNHRALAFGAVAVTGLVAACGTASTTSSATASPAPAGRMAIATMLTSIGTVLTGPDGHTIYVLIDDGRAVTCSGACLATWPPVTLGSGPPRTASGVTASLSTVMAGGATQLTVSGDPAHYYAGDGSAGDANGEGISSYGGIWYALEPNGHLFTPGSGGNPFGY